MEPVPETERMEEFRSAPMPKARLGSDPNALSTLDLDLVKKPPTIRRSTDPSPTSPSAFSWNSVMAIPYRPRTASPLSGTHTRSRSVASIGASPMSRTQSMPGVNGSGHILYAPQFRPASPAGSPNRARTPRKPADESFPLNTPVRSSVLEHEGPPSAERSSSPVLGFSSNTLARVRRPASPLRNYAQSSSGSISAPPSTPASSTSSLYRAYDPYGAGALSSVPSTPSSARSRSPSISSLETIPDSPDAEEAALEAERLAQLKAAADAADGADSTDGKGRGSLDMPTRGRTMAYGSRDKRKRWSVCGAERRGDLDLETIWED